MRTVKFYTTKGAVICPLKLVAVSYNEGKYFVGTPLGVYEIYPSSYYEIEAMLRPTTLLSMLRLLFA